MFHGLLTFLPFSDGLWAAGIGLLAWSRQFATKASCRRRCVAAPILAMSALI
jgi:hypothetical protein